MNLGLLLGAGIPLLVFAILGVVFSLVLRGRRRRHDELVAEMRASGEHVVAGPGWARKREGIVSVSGSLVVTDQRIVFVGGLGHRTSIARGDIVGVRSARAFNGEIVGGVEWTVLQTRAGDREIGFLTRVPGLAQAVQVQRGDA